MEKSNSAWKMQPTTVGKTADGELVLEEKVQTLETVVQTMENSITSMTANIANLKLQAVELQQKTGTLQQHLIVSPPEPTTSGPVAVNHARARQREKDVQQPQQKSTPDQQKEPPRTQSQQQSRTKRKRFRKAGKEEHTQVMVTKIVPFTTVEELRNAFKAALGEDSTVGRIRIWRLRDGILRALVHVPTRHVQALVGTSIRVGYTLCNVTLPKNHLPKKLHRCSRCLERGHSLWNCNGVDRHNVCLQCGVEGHMAGTCWAKPRCLSCGGPHRIGAKQCPHDQQQTEQRNGQNKRE